MIFEHNEEFLTFNEKEIYLPVIRHCKLAKGTVIGEVKTILTESETVENLNKRDGKKMERAFILLR